MQTADIEKILNDALTLDDLRVTFDGSQCSIIAVSDSFDDMSRVKKQQTVYAPLTEAINQGHIHAVSIKTFTNSQWQREKKFILPS
ncbi:BolA/IbaG family iron-sulfur metabolism protein [Thalassotalea litorea]|uniref:BolA/IbaG family iron-sulfur metabolism protein n=1 Tax=Thalassotalea litorea TaxID=2020715 RepID=A0A5R9IMC0_9GAMM|nr:BolA/IbaG family iron-sulfur metabolism protein [Thalassotalea litorea]TLU66694.1 BolA/IbaG family iron-sulfur metabolism protein [Thalassotalea litorea]